MLLSPGVEAVGPDADAVLALSSYCHRAFQRVPQASDRNRQVIECARHTEAYIDKRLEQTRVLLAVSERAINILPVQHIEDRRASICRRDDPVGAVLAPVPQPDTDGPISLNEYYLDARVELHPAPKVQVALFNGAHQRERASYDLSGPYR